MSFVVTPSAHETFTPRELTAAYAQFIERGAQYLSAESGFRAAAYQFGRRVLIVYQESETDVMVFIDPTFYKENSANFAITESPKFAKEVVINTAIE